MKIYFHHYINGFFHKSFYYFFYLKKREFIRFIKSYYKNKFIVGCEIGVKYGLNAINILKNCNIKELYLIEPDLSLFDYKMFNKYIKKYYLLNNYSYNVVDDIKDNSLDFCYIDGSHKYKDVKCDISLYYSKVCNGGIIGGHDYNLEGVSKAVIESFDDFFISDSYNYPIEWWKIKK